MPDPTLPFEPPFSLRVCAGGMAAAVAASESNLAAASACAVQELFGPAVALSVIAIEESCKARVYGALALHHLNDTAIAWGPEDLRKLLALSHTRRHVLAIVHAMSAASLTARALGILTRQPVPQATQEDADRAAWLLDANDSKQQGLYSDRAGDHWSEPRNFGVGDWREALRHLAPYTTETRRQFNGVTAAVREFEAGRLKGKLVG